MAYAAAFSEGSLHCIVGLTDGEIEGVVGMEGKSRPGVFEPPSNLGLGMKVEGALLYSTRYIGV